MQIYLNDISHSLWIFFGNAAEIKETQPTITGAKTYVFEINVG